jgi:hypothetical protein
LAVLDTDPNMSRSQKRPASDIPAGAGSVTFFTVCSLKKNYLPALVVDGLELVCGPGLVAAEWYGMRTRSIPTNIYGSPSHEENRAGATSSSMKEEKLE